MEGRLAPASLFSSARERRLWVWALVAVVAIYSTLGLSRTLVDVFDQDLLAGLFLLSMILIGASVVVLRLRRWPRRTDVAIAIGIGAVYLLLIPRIGSPVERSHLIEYTVVALFIYEALLERASHGRAVRFPAILAVVAATAVGVLDELIQLVLPFRVFDPIDMLFNFLAALIAVGASAVLARTRRAA